VAGRSAFTPYHLEYAHRLKIVTNNFDLKITFSFQIASKIVNYVVALSKVNKLSSKTNVILLTVTSLMSGTNSNERRGTVFITSIPYSAGCRFKTRLGDLLPEKVAVVFLSPSRHIL
jgi:hypothetical protein